MVLHARTNKAQLLTLVLFLAVFVSGAFAQQPPSPSPSPIDKDDGKDDLLFVVKLTAKELKFDVVPSTNVEFPGTKKRSTFWLTERTNLPEKLEPGVTYRNIGITLRISSRFEDIEQIVREAFGEVTPPLATPPQQTQTATTAVAPQTPPKRTGRSKTAGRAKL